MHKAHFDTLQTVRVMRLPLMGQRLHDKKHTTSPPLYISPLKVMLSGSPTLSPVKYKKLAELNNSVQMLHEYSTHLNKVEYMEQQNIRTLITNNKNERCAIAHLNFARKHQQANDHIIRKTSQTLERLRENDPFLMRDARHDLNNKRSSVSRIVQQHDDYTQRKRKLAEAIHQKKYAIGWNKMPLVFTQHKSLNHC